MDSNTFSWTWSARVLSVLSLGCVGCEGYVGLLGHRHRHRDIDASLSMRRVKTVWPSVAMYVPPYHLRHLDVSMDHLHRPLSHCRMPMSMDVSDDINVLHDSVTPSLSVSIPTANQSVSNNLVSWLLSLSMVSVTATVMTLPSVVSLVDSDTAFIAKSYGRVCTWIEPSMAVTMSAATASIMMGKFVMGPVTDRMGGVMVSP